MSLMGIPPESPDPSISDTAFVTEISDVGTVATTSSAEDAVAAGLLPAGKPRGSFRRGLLFCFLGPQFYHGNTTVVNFGNETLSPGAGHPLGTDSNGNDVLARLMTSGQISLEVGFAAAVLATVIGVLWGSVAGYVGGVIDAFMMRIVDAALSIPVLFLLLVLAALITPTEPILIAVIALVSWLTTARLVRGEALSLRTREYVQAMKVMGGGGTRAVLRHIAPNAAAPVLVSAAFGIASRAA